MKTRWTTHLEALALCAVALMMTAACVSGGKTLEEKARLAEETARKVEAAIEGRKLTVDVDYMYPAQGTARSVTASYGIRVSGDTLYSALPYFGRAYRLPYGGGKGLTFAAPINRYEMLRQRDGSLRVTIETRNEEDEFIYMLDAFDNGRAYLRVVMREREHISYSGQMNFGKEGAR